VRAYYYTLCDFRHWDLGDKETEFCRIAWSRIAGCDVVQHYDCDRIAGAVVDEPADVWIMIDAVKRDGMPVLGQDRLEQIEVEGDGSTLFGERERIVRRLPQFVGHWMQDEVGRSIDDQGEFMLGHAAI
jgi:hypothetical protein